MSVHYPVCVAAGSDSQCDFGHLDHQGLANKSCKSTNRSNDVIHALSYFILLVTIVYLNIDHVRNLYKGN